MSKKNCNRCKNPLLRDGTSQPQRFLPELDPAYVSIDERTPIDLIDFTFKYAQKLRFWETDNVTTGNWIGFIENDVATLITIVAKKKTDSIREDFQLALDNFLMSTDPDDFQELITKSLEVALEIDSWYKKSIPNFSLNLDLLKVIQTQAAPNMRILVSYDLAAQSFLGVPPANPIYPAGVSQLSSIWGDFNTVEEDNSVYGPIAGTDAVKMTSAYPSIVAIFETMLNAQEKLSRNAASHFDQILNEYPSHEAHHTLLLTFYQLFTHAQEYGNTLTARHMDFYYKDVLRMIEKDAVPDQVHLLFEPAKNIDSHLLTKGTLFKAGKDSTGKDIFFSLDKNVVINKATVDAVKNIFIHRNTDDQINYIFASHVANSTDGLGGELPENNPGWKMFGEHQKLADDITDIAARTMPNAEIGFAIASPELFLKEGERTISTVLEVDSDSLDAFVGFYAGIVDAQNAMGSNVQLFFSGAEGWIQPLANTTVGIDLALNTITITTGLLVEQPAVVPYAEEVLLSPFQTEWPVLKIVLNQASGSVVYDSMKALKLKGFTIDVDVKEVVSLVVANDNGTVDASKPFQPFGPIPEVGSNFYIGSEEVFSKKLKDLTITLDWQGVPSNNMASYYKEYKKNSSQEYIGVINSAGTVVNNGNHNFTAKLKILDEYRWRDLVEVSSAIGVSEASVSTLFSDSGGGSDLSTTVGSGSFFSGGGPGGLMFVLFAFLFYNGTSTTNRIELFNHDGGPDGPDPRLPRKLRVNNNNIVSVGSGGGTVVNNTFKLLTSYGYKRDVRLQKTPITEYTNSTKRGFVKLELNSPGFLHDIYPKIQTKQAIALGKHNLLGFGTTEAEPQLPNEPYTPVVKLMALDYKSEFKVNYQLVEFQNYDKRVEQLFHVGPFGVAEVFPVADDLLVAADPKKVYNTDSLFPRFATAMDTNAEATTEGEFFIGIKNLKPPQGVTLFFQFDEGTENLDLEVPDVKWSFLSNNQWIDFESKQIANDTTNGLVNSGIIEFSIPKEITNQNTILPAGIHWLRVQVNENTQAFSDVLLLQAQAASATYEDIGNDPNRLRSVIEPRVISKFVKKDFSVKTVDQPYASFGGRVEEQSNEFFTRAAERLRHKNRAITIRDYEHLVLEAYPTIYKVKCINHTSKFSENAPGSVSVITIPDPSVRNDKNPFELKVSKSKLEAIKTFLQQINSALVDLNVRNPTYEKIKVTFGVEFKKEFSDRTFYVNQLSEDIKRFISPWAFGEADDIVFGGRIDKSVILNFIEERPYVDFVDNFILDLYLPGEEFPLGGDPSAPGYSGIQEAVAQTAASVLITNDTHTINETTC